MNKQLNNARIVKDDEYFTKLTDIESELQHYKDSFKNKIIYCNADNPKTSNFWKYFVNNFNELKLKLVICTFYTKDYTSYITTYDGINIKSKKLNGNGDFRSVECIKTLQVSDIIVTNPPFSLFYEYFNTLIRYDKKFIIIGNKNAVTNKNVFPLIKDNKVWLGYTRPNVFDTPNGETLKVQGLCRWFTNIDIPRRYEKLITERHFADKHYDTYDVLPEVINVKRIRDIPIDYNGLMAVPITFIDSYNPEQFEIIDVLNRHTIFNTLGANDRSLKMGRLHCCSINGVQTYKRIIIRKKQ